MIIVRYPALATGVAIGVVVAGVEFAAGATVGEAALSLGIIAGYAVAVTVIGRRSEMASALAGRPVDERWEHFGLEASAAALGVSAIVVMIGFLAAKVSGGDWKPYAFMGAVMALSYLGSLVVLRARH